MRSRSSTTATPSGYFEAFKKGLFDVIRETDPTRWATQYDFPAVSEGRVVQVNFPTKVPKAMSGFVFNTERPIFADPKVREALTYCLDFEWLNHSIYFDLFKRTGSYFQGSELSALGRARERGGEGAACKVPRRGTAGGHGRHLRSAGQRRQRHRPRRAAESLRYPEGRWLRAERAMRWSNTATGAPLAFEVLVREAEDENLALAMQRTCALLGVKISVRRVESIQYDVRIKDFDYDMIRFVYPSSLSPGNEQNNRWSSANVHNPGAFNFSGAHDPAIDAMIDALLNATDRTSFVTAVRALRPRADLRKLSDPALLCARGLVGAVGRG